MPAAATEARDAAARRRWIHSAPFDLAVFVLSPLSGLLLVGAYLHLPGGLHALAVANYLVAMPHYLSTFTFYLDDERRSYYWSRRAAFVGGPLLIVAGVLALRAAEWDAPLNAAVFVWNVFHVARQSGGILAIYRRLGGGPDAEKAIAHRAILAVNATMAFWSLEGFPPLFGLLLRIGPEAPFILRAACLAVAAVSVGRLARALARRPAAIGLPEGAFLVVSLALFHPYLWAAPTNLATFAMLMGHFCQYLGIVWLLHRRAYRTVSGTAGQRLLARVSARPALLACALLGAGIAIFLVHRAARSIGMADAYLAFFYSLVLVHFYLDGVIWAFRHAFVRRSIGAFLIPARGVAA
jgi:hypothetical protein